MPARSKCSASTRVRRRREDRLHIERNTGVLFQDGALFSSLTVGENVQVPLKEHYRDLPDSLRYELALLKVKLAGLPADALDKLPSQLSGGMRKRAGAGARAGTGSAAAVPRRADRRPGPDRRRRLRPPDPDPAAGAGPDGVPHHPRPGHPVRYLRPRGGAGRPENHRGARRWRNSNSSTIRGCRSTSTARAGARRARRQAESSRLHHRQAPAAMSRAHPAGP